MPSFSIISNNCWSNKVYEHLAIPYQTPFINIFMAPECYLQMTSDLRWHLRQPLSFVSQSRHALVNALRDERQAYYPIAILGEVELQCLHFTSNEEVTKTWARRLARFVEDESRWFFKFSDDLGCTQSQLEEFDALPYLNKISFTSRPMPHLKSALYVPSVGDCVSFPDQTDWHKFNGPKWVS